MHFTTKLYFNVPFSKEAMHTLVNIFTDINLHVLPFNFFMHQALTKTFSFQRYLNMVQNSYNLKNTRRIFNDIIRKLKLCTFCCFPHEPEKREHMGYFRGFPQVKTLYQPTSC